MANKAGSGKRACASIYFRFRSLPRLRSHFSSDFNEIWNVGPLLQEKQQLLSVMQLEVIYAHVRNLTSGFLLICSVA